MWNFSDSTEKFILQIIDFSSKMVAKYAKITIFHLD